MNSTTEILARIEELTANIKDFDKHVLKRQLLEMYISGVSDGVDEGHRITLEAISTFATKRLEETKCNPKIN